MLITYESTIYGSRLYMREGKKKRKRERKEKLRIGKKKRKKERKGRERKGK